MFLSEIFPPASFLLSIWDPWLLGMKVSKFHSAFYGILFVMILYNLIELHCFDNFIVLSYNSIIY